VANIITVSRIPLLVGFVLMLYLGGPAVRLASVPYLFFAFMLDTVDGLIARRRQISSLIGSVLDIAADRVYELVLWVALADLGTIPVAIPIIVITRTTLTDALRSIGVREGRAPLQQHRSALGRFLVGSPWMRSSYSIAKVLAFCGLTLAVALAGYPEGSAASRLAGPILTTSQTIAWVAVALCIVRGIPVIAAPIGRELREHRQRQSAETP
jgi:phosphatidylglycerophosphate synthase